MASKIKLSNANGKIVTIENNDSNMSDVTLNGASITKKVDTLADMRAMNELPETVWCSGYHSKNDGAFGSHFYRLKGLKTTETDNSGTVIIASVGGSDYVYELQYDGAVNVRWFGAVGDGVTDDTVAIQLALDSNNIVYVPNGIFLLDTVTFIDPTGLYASRGSNIFGILFLNSNNIIYGEGTIKVADNILLKSYVYSADQYSGTYLGYQMPGAKGFQVFVQKDINDTIVNSTISDITIDLNGYNNKVYGLNSFGNQTQCHAVYFKNSDNCSINNVVFKDHPGSQCIALGTDCIDTKIINNTFIDAGMLDGTNTLLDDHSTIYSQGYNTLISGNKFTQTIQWTQKGGTPIEVHNKAVVINNTIDKYAACGVIAAQIMDGYHIIKNNIYTNISYLGFDCYCKASFDLDTVILSNHITLLKLAVDSSHPVYKYRSFINTSAFGYTPGTSNITCSNNKVEMIGTTAWNANDDIYNNVIHSNLVTELTLNSNSFKGFRGALIELGYQIASSKIVNTNNSIISMGRSDVNMSNNSLINYNNYFSAGHGIPLDTYIGANNSYISCYYSAYFGLNQASGQLLAPSKIKINNDNTDRWFAPFYTENTYDIYGSSLYTWSINYNCNSKLSANEILKGINTSYSNLMKTQTGEIKLETGTFLYTYTSQKNILRWNCSLVSFGDTAPIASEISPFGAYQSDKKWVVNPSAGGNIGWVCTVAGTPGTWKSFGTISA